MVTFRIDDIGASTKQFEQYGRWKIGNFLFLKRVRPFKKWGPYEELTVGEWQEFLEIFSSHNIVPVISITASWVEKNGALTPFPKKFPEQAEVLKIAFLEGRIVVANHGLTHSVVGKHLPRFLTSNRKYHREFLQDLPQELHTEHILKSQEILENFFERPVTIFVPPGNVWSKKTYQALKQTSIKKVIAKKYMADSQEPMQSIKFICDKQGFFCFHDRELKLYGAKWLITQTNQRSVGV